MYLNKFKCKTLRMTFSQTFIVIEVSCNNLDHIQIFALTKHSLILINSSLLTSQPLRYTPFYCEILDLPSSSFIAWLFNIFCT